MSGALGARDASDELPLLYRVAILYLALPAGVWLVGWFEWWVWLPLGALCAAALWPALRGDWRLRREDVRLDSVAAVAAAGAWVGTTAAGGFFDEGNGDWFSLRTMLLDLGRHAWPVFLPETLGAYAAGDYPDPLLRFYLGWHMVPGLAAKVFGPWALNWIVPLWTWAGTAMVLLMFTRGRRGWRLAVAALIFAFFSGMDILRVIAVEGWDYVDIDVDLSGFPGIAVSPGSIEWEGLRHIFAQYSSNMTALAWTPHHFIASGICALTALRMGGNARFLAVAGVLLAAAAFWSVFVAVGMLPLMAALALRSGLRPFLTWQNLLAAPALAGLIGLYFASGATDFGGQWIWAGVGWANALIGLGRFWTSEFLALALLLLALRPAMRREPMFIAAIIALLVLPLYEYDNVNNLALRGSIPALMTICFYCAEVIVPSEGHSALRGGMFGKVGWGLACSALVVGAFTPMTQLIFALNDFGYARYEGVRNTALIDLPWRWQAQRVALDPPPALLALLSDEPRARREKGTLAASGDYDVFLERDRLVLVKRGAGGDCEFNYDGRFFLVVAPSDGSPPFRAVSNPQNVRGRLFGDTCVIRMPLPDYAISGFAVGQYQDDGSVSGWMLRDLDFAAAYSSLASGDPIARSVFDLRVRDNLLVYAKAECGAEDTRERFFLHIVPANASDLRVGRGVHGFNNADFWFKDYGLRIDESGSCVAILPLPDYEIVEVRTGQFNDDGMIWAESIDIARQ